MRACLNIIKMLLNVYHFGKEICKLCDSFVINSYTDILFECESLCDIRDVQYRYLQGCLDPNLYNDLFYMDNCTRCYFCFNMFNGQYLYEFDSSYAAICLFINAMYFKYCNKMKVLVKDL